MFQVFQSGLYQLYLLCGGGWGGAHVGQWDAVNELQNVLDLLVRDFNVQQRELPQHLESKAQTHPTLT